MATAAMQWDDPLLLEGSLLTEDERLIMHNARGYCQVGRCAWATVEAAVGSRARSCPTPQHPHAVLHLMWCDFAVWAREDRGARQPLCPTCSPPL